MPYPRRFYRVEPFDHGEMLSRPRFGIVAAALITAIICFFFGASNWVKPHALLIDLPSFMNLAELPVSTPITVVSVTPAGTLLQDNEIVSPELLRKRLRAGLYEHVEPLTRFEPHANASYARVLEALAIIAQSGVTKFCFGNLREFGIFGKHTVPLFLTYPPPENWLGYTPPDPAPTTRISGCDVRTEPGPAG